MFRLFASMGKGGSKIHEAVKRNVKYKVIKILSKNRAGLNERDLYGETPLLIASCNGYVEIVNILLEYGAHPDIADPLERTPLYAACYFGHVEVVRTLLDKGADVYRGETSDNWSPLCVASREGHLDIVKLLACTEANISHKGDSGLTPLHHAIAEEHTDVALYLLEKGANAGAMDNLGLTPLIGCALLGNNIVLKHLLHYDADPNVIYDTNGFGFSALNVAASRGNYETAALLLNNGASVDQVNSKGWTALHSAIAHQHFAVVELLLHHGANPNIREFGRGCTAIHIALSHKLGSEFLPLLLKHNADVNIQTYTGDTSLHIALTQIGDETDIYDTACLLINHGAHIDIQNKNNITPMDCYDSKTMPAILDFCRPLPLTCLCAQQVSNHNSLLIECQFSYPKSVTNFVAMHRRYSTEV